MSGSSSQSEDALGYFGSKVNELHDLFIENTEKRVILEDLKPLLDEALSFLESTNDYGTEEVKNALLIQGLAPECLMDDRHSHLETSVLDGDTDQLITRQHEVGQHLIQQEFSSIVVKVLKCLQEKLSDCHITRQSDQYIDQCEMNILVLCETLHIYTGTYPMRAAPFCRSICKEGGLEILAQSLLHFDDSDSNIPNKTDRFLKTKKEILATLSNIITECPDYRDKYRHANIVKRLVKKADD